MITEKRKEEPFHTKWDELRKRVKVFADKTKERNHRGRLQNTHKVFGEKYDRHFEDLKMQMSEKKVEMVFEDSTRTKPPMNGFMEYYTYQFEQEEQKHKEQEPSRKQLRKQLKTKLR